MTNPLLAPWDGPFGLPDFAAVTDDHFRPAFDAAIARQDEEFEAICADPEPATFRNTVDALERHGLLLDRVAAIFFNRAGADTNAAIQEIEREIMPRLSRLHSKQMTDPRIFARLEAVVADQGGLTSEQARVLDLMVKAYIRGGARLDQAGKDRMAQIMARLSELGTAFSQNVLKDEADWSMTLGPEDLDGLPDFLRQSARAEAERREIDGWVITLARSSVEPFLTFSDRRDLRERAFRAWAGRGEATNWALIEEMVALRIERAQLLGFRTFAAFKLQNEMARDPGGVRGLLTAVWSPARDRAGHEAAALQALAAEEGANIDIAPWDWRYYAEKVRKRRLRSRRGGGQSLPAA